ncbi:LPS O-antigen length regulator Wzz(fepE) [Arsenophonus apicola]|uniref:LPS O-antigen length regulator Wzz(FepE) n=1 Tax=Arsenophonus apicola TaxID=2879119 RepID=A0ABY8P3U3_9GAMM|nr:LPS O-antigen length regulator Wzz(fepE) [Arsenophonus apicola]WGO84168.1 LPS O-antigen length regulator Wzz(fepE) [Arsenophonus apicola]
MTNRPLLDATSEIDPSFYSAKMKQDDEIDLFELFSILYKSKWLITMFVVVFTAAIFCWTLFSPQKWKSEASIVQPTTQELFKLNEFLSQLKVLDIETNIDAQQVYAKFLDAYRSQLLQENFLKSSDYFQRLVKSSESQLLEREQQLLRDMINNITVGKVTFSNSADNNVSNTTNMREWPIEASIEFTAATAQDAQDLLSDYLRYIGSNIRQEIKAELNEKIAQQLVYAKGKYAIELATLENANRVAIQRLKNSLAIAQSVGLKKPVSTTHNFIQDDPDYPIALGSEALAKKLAIIEKANDLSLSNPDLLSSQQYIQQLKALDTKDIWFQPVKYMQKPTLPIAKQAPNRTYMLVLAGIAGLIFGCIYVLLRHMVNNRKQKV